MHPKWISEIRDAITSGTCASIAQPVPWNGGTALSLAPHPDDPDAVAVTLRLLADHGWDVYWAIATSGWSGVLDDYCGPEQDVKALARVSEQIRSARLFGLPEERLLFMGLTETQKGVLAWTDQNYKRFNDVLNEIHPDLVLLPHGLDTNATHRMVYQWFAEWADEQDYPVIALGNEDPKSEDFHAHARVLFDEERARWKASLLECHRTQSIRNQRSRGITFAERILSVNRRAAGDVPNMYAERFTVTHWNL